MDFSRSCRPAENDRLFLDVLCKNESFDLIIPCDVQVTLAIRLLNCRVKAELLIIHHVLAEHDSSGLEFVLVDVEGVRYRAA